MYTFVSYGSRDFYQVPLALKEVGLLDSIVTDLYVGNSHLDFFEFAPLVHALLKKRNLRKLGNCVTFNIFFIKILSELSLRILRCNPRVVDTCLDELLSKAASFYLKTGDKKAVFCYSYYWNEIASSIQRGSWRGASLVFQVHPHPGQIQRDLRMDREITGLSYLPDKEEACSEREIASYTSNLQQASLIICSSRYTSKGLTEHGIPSENVAIVPYGFATQEKYGDHFGPFSMEDRWSCIRPLKLLFVGQLAYRKGLHHLLKAVSRFTSRQVTLSIVTRSHSMPQELAGLISSNVHVYTQIDKEELRYFYSTHHLFTMPSLVEGFVLVYLEAMSNGLPVLATLNTGIADLILDNEHGFIVPVSCSDSIVERLERILAGHIDLREMSQNSLGLAQAYSWEDFRRSVSSFALQVIHS